MKFIIFFITFSQLSIASVLLSDNKSPSWMIAADEETTSEINEENFHSIINEVTSLYIQEGIDQQRSLVIRVADWQVPYYSAWARYEDENDLYTINFWGGFARIPTMTERGFALTVCHEIGHILAGEPRLTLKHSDKMSAEGQSDYFASSKCFKKYQQKFPFPLEVELNPFAASKCLDKFTDSEQLDLCLQTAKAGSDLAAVLSFHGQVENSHFETPDLTEVEETINNSYPSIQCRLDTFLAGALSDYGKNEDLRPKCWYKQD